ncbi:MAG TPA: S8 family serine peptidase [Pyrinomonadaceae bacterium]|nr:S8 family serine peptidase [Pyrinomonadaceae bacterium]
MNLRTPRSAFRVFVYALCTVVCVAVLLQVSTVISSSHQGSEGPASAATKGNVAIDTVYRSGSSAIVDQWKQLFPQNPAEKVAARVLADTSDGKTASVVIMLADQADVSAAYAMKDQDARGWYVYQTLTEHAARTQVGLQSFLKSAGARFQCYWAANLIVATADRSLVDRLAARTDVGRVDSNTPLRGIEDPVVAKFGVNAAEPNAPTAVEPGVTNVNAPALWALGFTGQGMIVGNEDTGMRWDHNALKPKYRGWNGAVADHNFNWHDSIHSGGGSCGANSVVPCDDQGHGTHTTGTTVGDDGTGNQVGVAPGAKWIGCRNMDQGSGTPATYTECFQFFIAPTDLAGNNANPALRPHVINNSWGCPVSEGCTTGTELQTIVNNTQAAGIFVVVSAGNSGSACSTVQDAPAFYDASFSVGAISGTTNVLASFSSRGPGTLAPNLLKPNVSAPGVSVRSTLRTTVSSYGSMSGTSMAGPHVAGVVALLWSARPSLVRNIAQTKAILQVSANPGVTVSPAQTCGGTLGSTPGLSQIPNNSFGYGRVDVLAAYNNTPTAASASVSGQVTTAAGQPLAGATVQMSGGAGRKTITDSNGNYVFENVETNKLYTVTPARLNYHFSPENRSFSLMSNQTDAVFTANIDAVHGGNVIDSADYFVRQHYLDFLGREPDETGFTFWSDQILSCGSDVGCGERRTINVSAAYFLSIEFQQTGGLVDGLYRASFGRRPMFAEFMPDTAIVARDVVVGRSDWAQTLEANKQAFVAAWVQRQEFRAAYDQLSNAAFVDALIAHTEGSFNGDRDGLVSALNSSTITRAAALRLIVDNNGFTNAKSNKMFVMMEYFGYLRRDPDPNGYEFWLNKLNQFNGNFEQAEMVKAFIVSGEYRARFAQ